MLIETLSVFPEMFEPVMSTSILGRARKAGLFDFKAYNLRDWTHDRHRTVDDEPYGGGQGMLMKVEPIAEAIEAISSEGPKPTVVFFTPCGEPFTQHVPSACSKASVCCLYAAATRASTNVHMRMPTSACRSATMCSRAANFPLWSLPMPSYA
mgnify:FL=1